MIFFCLFYQKIVIFYVNEKGRRRRRNHCYGEANLESLFSLDYFNCFMLNWNSPFSYREEYAWKNINFTVFYLLNLKDFAFLFLVDNKLIQKAEEKLLTRHFEREKTFSCLSLAKIKTKFFLLTWFRRENENFMHFNGIYRDKFFFILICAMDVKKKLREKFLFPFVKNVKWKVITMCRCVKQENHVIKKKKKWKIIRKSK